MNLTKSEINNYLNDHLPYRLNSLMAWDIMMYRHENKVDQCSKLPTSPYQDSLVVEPAFEISLVFGRALMEFLGIKYGLKNNRLIELKSPKSTDDITLKSLFFDRHYCPLNDTDLQQNESDIAILFKVANKSVAHLTGSLSNSTELERIPAARKAIYHLILKYVPEIPINKLWYHNQVLSHQINNT